ncbi:hypothetical protein [Cellulomonas sp. URHE0023]|uniref:hypothetical protein n=1 Tax=Cellulomonas sp. URHE0023 TaxID=1380354 RepID=UPI00048296B2|nr:hypothetical protein [Cellulomonas sp. URHE0023]
MLLTPNVGRFDATWLRRQYEGTSLAVGPERITWAAPSYVAFRRGGFDLAVGDKPGQARTVTHIRTMFPSQFSPGLIDRYLVTDISGTVLGAFPSGFGETGSALPEHFAGWYPVAAVKSAVEAAGMRWEDRNYIGNAPDLERDFPGVVPKVRGRHAMVWGLTLTYCIAGAVFIVLPWVARPESGHAPIVFILLAELLGAWLLFVGVTATPAVMRRRRERLRARQAATHASSEASGD